MQEVTPMTNPSGANSHRRRALAVNHMMTAFFYGMSLTTLALLLAIIGYLFWLGLKDFSPALLSFSPRGIGNQLFNTIYLVVLALCISVPIGIGTGIYMAEYAKPGRLQTTMRISIETLSSLPSIVVGLFGYLVFIILTGSQWNLLAGALTVSILTLPLIATITEDALRALPPGYAKGRMRNAILIGMELNGLLPAEQRPEYTEGYEGFLHIVGFNGTVEEATFSYIIRDHDMDLFESKKEMLRKCVGFINAKYGDGTATVDIQHQYYNMRKEVEPHYHIIEKAVKAMEMEGIKPHIQPIRGGTDGANLSFMGLPCPNIFAGGHNFHGKLEYVPLESMEKAGKVILNIISLFAEE